MEVVTTDNQKQGFLLKRCALLVCLLISYYRQYHNLRKRGHFRDLVSFTRVLWGMRQKMGMVGASIKWDPTEQFGSRESGRVLRATLVFRGVFFFGLNVIVMLKFCSGSHIRVPLAVKQ